MSPRVGRSKRVGRIENLNNSRVVGIPGLHHARHAGFVGRELSGVVARHLGIIPAPGVHDAGEINAAGSKIMCGTDPRGVCGDVICGPRMLADLVRH